MCYITRVLTHRHLNASCKNIDIVLSEIQSAVSHTSSHVLGPDQNSHALSSHCPISVVPESLQDTVRHPISPVSRVVESCCQIVWCTGAALSAGVPASQGADSLCPVSWFNFHSLTLLWLVFCFGSGVCPMSGFWMSRKNLQGQGCKELTTRNHLRTRCSTQSRVLGLQAFALELSLLLLGSKAESTRLSLQGCDEADKRWTCHWFKCWRLREPVSFRNSLVAANTVRSLVLGCAEAVCSGKQET